MKYEEVEGDLIDLFRRGRFNIIAHGCNCFHTMGSGIARQLRENFAEIFEADKKTSYGDINKLGTIDVIRTYQALDLKRIINCYTQFNYGLLSRCLDYEALTLCLRKINMMFSNDSIGLPKIGCGLGAGDWSIVKRIIRQELIDMNITVVIYGGNKQ